MADVESQIGFEQIGLGSVLKRYQLAVPPNQREYSWGERQVTQLLLDFAKAIADGEKPYFLGTVVTIPRQNGILEVVDGQQRLATTAILLASIRDWLKGKEDIIAESVNNEFLTGIDRVKRERVPKLRLNLDDNEYFRARITDTSVDTPCLKPSHELLEDAFKFCKTQVQKVVAGFDNKDHGDILNQWIHFIEKRALVVLLLVPNDANAYKMFETLNDRGLRTSQSDLVKNYLFGRSGERLPEVQQKWTLMRGALETLDDDITIDFLRHALTVAYGFVRESQVYDAVQNVARSEQSSVSFMSSLENLASTYVAIQNPEHEIWNRYSDATRRSIEVLNLLNIRPLRPLELSVAAKFSPKEAEHTFELMISVGVRLLIAATTRSGSIEETIANVAHGVYTDEVDNTKGVKKLLEKIVPSNEQFSHAFETATVSSAKLARYYLRSLELAAKNEPEPWHMPNDDKQVINLEHVLPIKPEKSWPQFDQHQHRLYHRRIGNLALLRATHNSDLRSASFAEKKKAYSNSPYMLTQQVAEAVEWTPEQIVARQKGLTAYALKAWPF